ncbi:MAG: sodium:calcium antiporter [Rickettsiales bacterium]|nr:sodium:calcium antiporter [Rickettsiales bacterium]
MLIALQIIGGLLMLVAGGEALVRGAVSIARALGIPIIVIGLTIVSLGTSAPEMVISVHASLSGHPDIALGNVIGSNIANVLLVLGATALIYPVTVEPDMIRRDGMLMVLVTVLLVIFMATGVLTRLEGGIFLAVMAGYLFYLWRTVRSGKNKELVEELKEETDVHYPTWLACVMLAAGLGLLMLGADILVGGASDFARILGVTEGVIGLTIVAVGTSAPELVTCVVAAYRRHSDIAIGNVVGSNLFNIFAVLGVASVIAPIPVSPQFWEVDIWIAVAVSLILLPIMLTGKTVSRLEGGLLLAGYIAYTLYQYTIGAQ